ncbi:glycosyltransferase family 2 protein [Marinobacter fonticola]|uniref:glycosyltransferase family 2 protein n=1 Tax=Marinobacter fonticola TaxID=2603215 RepID=UPI0011E6C5AB|nr:glycosyltransferase family A protein [Marinobacter fonticola]
MKVDVIIPCYNAERYLAQTIGSALEQTLAPHQIIVIDDGSTDESLAIARTFEAACKGQVRVHTERSGNAARSRNIGASLSEADAFMFLDADDVLAPDALAALASALSSQPKGMAACPWRRLKLVENKWTGRPATCAPRHPDQDALAAWLTGWYYPPCALLWSKTAFVQSGRWDEEATVNDDGDLVMRALANGIPLAETSSGTAYYRVLPEGQVSLSGKKATYGGLTGRFSVVEKIAVTLEEQGLIETYRSAVARAFEFIEKDAAKYYAGLSQQARLKKEHYGLSRWQRLMARAGESQGSGSQTQPVTQASSEEPDEISFGIALAEQLLADSEAAATEERLPWPTPIHRPTVSVIIPVFNRAHLLRRTIDSVVAQSFPDFEVLLVDDCSDDDPAAVVESFGDSRLRYLRQPQNQGVAAARNRGLREAKGEYIAFLDDDDEWFPEKLALQVELFRRSSPEVGLVYTGVETVADDGSYTLQVPSARGDLYRELLVRNLLHGGGSNIMIPRNVIARVGFFDENLPAIEDYDYWLRICRWYKTEVVSAPLIRYNDFRVPLEGKERQERRSLDVKANLDARARFFEKHGAEMRRAGLAHLFLITSARRSLVPEWNDVRGARRLAFKALLLAPKAWGARDVLIRTFWPLAVLRAGVDKGRHVLGSFQGLSSRMPSGSRSRR